MGEINDKLCKLFGVKEYFADFWNGTTFAKRYRIQPYQLCRDDKEYYKVFRKSTNVRRDIFMRLHGKMACMLGLEIMETIDYTIPARIMDYNAQEMKRQLNDIAIKNRQLIEIEQVSWEHGGEFLYGVKKADRILPILTVALYCGWEAYDGANGILEMCSWDNMPKECKEQFRDYPLQLYSLRELEEENFQTGLRELVAVFKRSKDRTAMKEYYLKNKERFQQLDEFVIDAMEALIGVKKLKMFTQEGRGLDLCKAFDDEREEGREEGVQIGTERVNKLIRYLIRDKRSDEIERVVSDMAYQGVMLREYGLA